MVSNFSKRQTSDSANTRREGCAEEMIVLPLRASLALRVLRVSHVRVYFARALFFCRDFSKSFYNNSRRDLKQGRYNNLLTFVRESFCDISKKNYTGMDGAGRCLGREFNISGPSWAHTSFKEIWSYHLFVRTGPKRNVRKCKTYAHPSVPAFLALILKLVLYAQVLLPVRVSDVSIQQNQIKIKMHFSFSTKWLSLKETLCTQ